MSALLAVETSGSVCSVAVAVDRRLVVSMEILRPNVHDARLAALVQQACVDADVDVQHLDYVAVSSGPGSFTGLRIGVALAKGLCVGSGAKLIGVPTTTALFHASSEVAVLSGSTSMLCVIPSHADMVYVAQSPVSDDRHLAEVRLVRKDELAALREPRMLCVGPGAEFVDSHPVSGLTRLSGRFVAYAAWRLLDAGHPTDDPMTFAPEYHQEFRPR